MELGKALTVVAMDQWRSLGEKVLAEALKTRAFAWRVVIIIFIFLCTLYESAGYTVVGISMAVGKLNAVAFIGRLIVFRLVFIIFSMLECFRFEGRRLLQRDEVALVSSLGEGPDLSYNGLAHVEACVISALGNVGHGCLRLQNQRRRSIMPYRARLVGGA
jgi:hypothetical protein